MHFFCPQSKLNQFKLSNAKGSYDKKTILRNESNKNDIEGQGEPIYYDVDKSLDVILLD